MPEQDERNQESEQMSLGTLSAIESANRRATPVPKNIQAPINQPLAPNNQQVVSPSVNAVAAYPNLCQNILFGAAGLEHLHEICQEAETKTGVDCTPLTIVPNSTEADAKNLKAMLKGNEVHFSTGTFGSSDAEITELFRHEVQHYIQQQKGQVDTNVGADFMVAQNPELEKSAENAEKGNFEKGTDGTNSLANEEVAQYKPVRPFSIELPQAKLGNKQLYILSDKEAVVLDIITNEAWYMENVDTRPHSLQHFEENRAAWAPFSAEEYALCKMTPPKNTQAASPEQPNTQAIEQRIESDKFSNPELGQNAVDNINNVDININLQELPTDEIDWWVILKEGIVEAIRSSPLGVYVDAARLGVAILKGDWKEAGEILKQAVLERTGLGTALEVYELLEKLVKGELSPEDIVNFLRDKALDYLGNKLAKKMEDALAAYLQKRNQPNPETLANQPPVVVADGREQQVQKNIIDLKKASPKPSDNIPQQPNKDLKWLPTEKLADQNAPAPVPPLKATKIRKVTGDETIARIERKLKREQQLSPEEIEKYKAFQATRKEEKGEGADFMGLHKKFTDANRPNNATLNRNPDEKAIKFGDDRATLNVAKNVKPLSGWIDVVLHGESDFFVLSIGGEKKFIDQRELTTYLLSKGVKKGTPLRLISCTTGRNIDGIAQHLANAFGAKIMAPSEPISVDSNGKELIQNISTRKPGKWNYFEPDTSGLLQEIFEIKYHEQKNKFLTASENLSVEEQKKLERFKSERAEYVIERRDVSKRTPKQEKMLLKNPTHRIAPVKPKNKLPK